jgi:hypothetical protein
MNLSDPTNISRRNLGKRVGQVAVATALSGLIVPHVHAAENPTIRVALIGCGGRGTGAAGDALRAKGMQAKLVAMADVFTDRLESSFQGLSNSDIAPKMDVPKERQFIGFDAYKHAMDCLKPGDVAIFTTPLAFRPVHFAYAIEKNLNVFMEKPLCADGAHARWMLKLCEEAKKKNLKVGVGLMSRHARHLQELQKRIADGAIGDIVLMRGYRMGPSTLATFKSPPKPHGMTDVEYQIRRFHSFLWASGGCFNDYFIHIVDHLSWMKNAWPVKAQGVGGRHFKHADDGTPYVDQNFDSYGIEYTFADGTKLVFDGRCIDNTVDFYSSFVHGTKGCAVASRSGDCSGPSAIYKGFAENRDNRLWQSVDHTNPYQDEWDDLMEAIIKDKPYNEVKRGVEASVVSSMGRMAAHIGQEVTFDEMLKSEHEFSPNIDKLTLDSPGPLPADKNGRYPKPEPGKKGRKEY